MPQLRLNPLTTSPQVITEQLTSTFFKIRIMSHFLATVLRNCCLEFHFAFNLQVLGALQVFLAKQELNSKSGIGFPRWREIFKKVFQHKGNWKLKTTLNEELMSKSYDSTKPPITWTASIRPDQKTWSFKKMRSSRFSPTDCSFYTMISECQYTTMTTAISNSADKFPSTKPLLHQNWQLLRVWCACNLATAPSILHFWL